MNEIVWTEERIEALPKEDNTFDRKASALFATAGPEGDRFRTVLAKQLSAFANSRGGNIILGVDDDGRIDGGLPLVAKGSQATKDYLEALILTLTDEKIVGFRVHEVTRKGNESRIMDGKAVFVVEVPDSDRAPHQSKKDNLYYIRLGSRSEPAPHGLIEDIRNRARHPKLEVSAMVMYSANYLTGYSPPHLNLRLRVSIRNISRICARSVCLTVSSVVPLNCEPYLEGEPAKLRFGSPGNVVLEITHAIYPGMEVGVKVDVLTEAQLSRPRFELLPSGLVLRSDGLKTLAIGGVDWAETPLRTTLYADSAPAQIRDFKLREIDSRNAIEKIIRANS